MDTLPVAAALALAEVLGLGLPAPCLVSVTAWLLDRPRTASADLQFSGPGRLDALRSWAARFGVPVDLPASGQGFAYVRFTRSGVPFKCYAQLGTDES